METVKVLMLKGETGATGVYDDTTVRALISTESAERRSADSALANRISEIVAAAAVNKTIATATATTTEWTFEETGNVFSAYAEALITAPIGYEILETEAMLTYVPTGATARGYKPVVIVDSRSDTTFLLKVYWAHILFRDAAEYPDLTTGFETALENGDYQVTFRYVIATAGGISGSVSGSTVTVNQVLTSGTEIATIAVDGVSTSLYAPASSGTGLSSAAITALLNCFQHVAWTDANGQTYYDALETALGGSSSATLTSITAAYSGSSLSTGTTLTVPLSGLTVTATYSDGTTEIISSGYTLSPTTLSEGNNTITVTYGGKTATFTVAASSGSTISLVSISATYSGGEVATGVTLTVPLSGLTVTATYSDGSTSTISSGYTLSPTTVSTGSNTITVTYADKTATFTVTGMSGAISLTGISASYSGGSLTTGTTLTVPLSGLTVTATYSDGSTSTVSSDYALSPTTISTGTNTITVTYGSETATFTVTGVTSTVTLSSLALTLSSATAVSGTSTSSLVSSVIGTYSDGSTATLTSANWSISPSTISTGTNSVTVTYDGVTSNAVTVTGTAVTVSTTAYYSYANIVLNGTEDTAELSNGNIVVSTASGGNTGIFGTGTFGTAIFG